MTTIGVEGGNDILPLPVNQGEYNVQRWRIKYTQSHMLPSKCSKCEKECTDDADPCQFCVFNRALELRRMPEMVFPNNVLVLKHRSGAIIEFNALDALKRVSNGKIHLQLACAEASKESRLENKEFLEEEIQPFDPSFTTDYMGTMSGFEVEEIGEGIDVEKLKLKESIKFYHDLKLYEDELHKRGIASTSVKIRVLSNSLFILLRYFLRIDNVMIRVNDTRLYHEFHHNYMLREFTSRQAKLKDLCVPRSFLIEPSIIAPHLPLRNSCYHKLIIPSKSVNSTTQNVASKPKDVDTICVENITNADNATADSSIQKATVEDSNTTITANTSVT